MGVFPKIWINILLLVFVSFLSWVYTEECFKFLKKQENYVLFNVTDANLSESAEFSLTFRTSKPDGMIFYIEGMYSKEAPYDFESVYLRDGKLNYLVFNPDSTGIGRSYGSHVMTDFDVNTNEDIQVNFFRRKESPATSHDLGMLAHLARENETAIRTVFRSGFVVNGKEFTTLSGTFPLDLKDNQDEQYIWIGGAFPSRKMEHFDGIIRDIVNIELNQVLDSPDGRSLYLSCEEADSNETE
ncbi:uncharacterized protein LOC133193705 [Saccostrea echinata]|uniref:uncharacterized protein LOC133193705 n=1 Tax=Saccostrea echinata TaxID=191078 RepID=UPI002A816622|nr:uncharacterized protein LOC133193705 [Saccostrea echinata]